MKLSPLRVFGYMVLVLFALESRAQLTSDVVPRERVVTPEEEISRELQVSSLRVGPFRLQPQLLFRNIRYTDNVYGTVDEDEEKVEDYGATVAAGTRWILPFGPKAYIRGTALPDYTWSAELPERRFVGGTYNVSAIALFNRLTVEADLGTSEGLAAPSSETELEVVRDLTWYGVDAEVDLSGYFSLFASVRAESHEHEDEGAGGLVSLASLLDRDDGALRAGIRYRLTSFLDFTVAGEQARSEFAERPAERDNRSEAVLLGVHYERPRSYLNLTVGQRRIEPEGSSLIESFDDTVGSYFAALATRGPIEMHFFGRRAIAYALSPETPFVLGNHHGIGTVVSVGHRLRLRASGELGTDDYRSGTGVVPEDLRREDEVSRYGAGLDFRIRRNVEFRIFVSQSEYDSSIDLFDRTRLDVVTGLTIGGITLTGDFPG